MTPVRALTPDVRASFVGRRFAMEDKVKAAVDAVWDEFRKDPDAGQNP